MMDVQAQLTAVMQKKRVEFEGRGDLVACALTGSLARGRVWAGSDLDFWGFRANSDEDFEDGMVGDVYWEIDIQPLDWLRGWDAARFLQPPKFSSEEFGVTPMEALWGARVLFDRQGTLTQVTALVQQLTDDKAWLWQRGENYVLYGMQCLGTLNSKPAEQAILDARRIAIVYGVSAYWMRRFELLSSVIRIPERLSSHPEIQNLLRGIFALNGQQGWDDFYATYLTLPASLREEADPDMNREILPAVRLGMAEGGMCHFRFIADGWLPLDVVRPIMGFETDIEAQKERVLDATDDLLRCVAAM